MNISKEELKSYELGLPKRLTINGVTDNYESRKIPLNKLFYNDMNGRISTHMEEYSSSHLNVDFNDLIKNNIFEYNNLIAKFVKDSAADDGKSYNKTKEDIRRNGQKEVGVVLSDGRIIDGNRRFTALRELYLETGDPKYGYFEAVCLDAPVPGNKEKWKQIKLLELNLQFNVDEKRQYNRIDFLVSFWKDTICNETKIFEKQEYVYATGIKESEFDKNVRIVLTMLDYLNWRGIPKSFYVLKNEKLDGPIEDIANKRNKINDSMWEEKKGIVFNYLTINNQGDRTREIRKLIDSLINGSKLFAGVEKALLKDNNEFKAAKIIELMNSSTPLTSEQYAELSSNRKDISDVLLSSFNEGSYEDSMEKVINAPKETLEKILNQISTLDLVYLKNITADQKEEIQKSITKLENKITEIKNAIDKK